MDIKEMLGIYVETIINISTLVVGPFFIAENIVQHFFFCCVCNHLLWNIRKK